MARVLYLCQYVVGPDQPGGVRHWQHAQALVREGHEVSIVTSYVLHQDRAVPDSARGRRIVRTREAGLDVWRTWSTPDYGRDVRSRVRSYASFSAWALLAAMRAPRPDVVVASSPPLSAGALGAVVARARGARLLLEVRDLWPESAVATGLVTDHRAVAAIDRLARWCYARSDRIVALTRGIAEGLAAAGVNPAAVTLITNGVDAPEVQSPAKAPVPVPQDAFVAMFVGQHATYSALETLLEAAAHLRADAAVRFVLVGGGDRKPDLVARAAARGLDNVLFHDPVPKREVPGWLGRADVCLIPYQDRALFAGALPNKAFDYLGAARPVIAAVPEGELSRLVRDAGCGLVVPAEDGAALAAAVRWLRDNPQGAARMGAAGAAYAREHYDRRCLASRFVGVVESLA